MTATRPKTLLRALVGLLSLGVVLTPTLIPASAGAATYGSEVPQGLGPERLLPRQGDQDGQGPADQQPQKHAGTDIKARCSAGVYASHPGTARV